MFKRKVLIGNVVYDTHRVGAIWHAIGDASTIFVHHVEGDVFDANWIETQYRHELDWTLTPERAEEWIKDLPEFEEYVDPEASLIEQMAEMLDDEEAATVPQAFREWQPDTDYAAGDRRRYADVLYKCLIAHTSQGDQTPDVAPSLWARIIASEDPDNPLPWEQPDSTNPYMKGDRVTHNDQVWESDYDNNVWEPGVFGWHVVEAV